MTSRRLRSTPETSASMTVVLACRARICADRGCDVGRRKSRGRDLVEQRLEQVVVLTVDDDDVDRRPLRSALAAVRPAKPAPTMTMRGLDCERWWMAWSAPVLRMRGNYRLRLPGDGNADWLSIRNALAMRGAPATFSPIQLLRIASRTSAPTAGRMLPSAHGDDIDLAPELGVDDRAGKRLPGG